MLGDKTPFQVRQGKQFNKLEKEVEAPQHPMPICAGKGSFIRQVRPSGRITLLGEKFQVGKRLKGQFVKATIFTKTEKLKIYLEGHIVKEWPYKLRKGLPDVLADAHEEILVLEMMSTI